MSEEVKTSTETKSTRGRKRKITALKNMRSGKLFICGEVLDEGEVVTVTKAMLEDEYQKKLIDRAISMGLVKSV